MQGHISSFLFGFGLTIFAYVIILLLLALLLKIKYDQSFYISLSLFVILFFVLSIASTFEGFWLTELLSVAFCVPELIAGNLSCYLIGFLEHPVFGVILCILTTAFMVFPVLIKPLHTYRKKKKNQKNQRAE